MPLVFEYQFAAICDSCGESYVDAFFHRAEFMKKARGFGWSFNGKVVRCPECKANRKKEVAE